MSIIKSDASIKSEAATNHASRYGSSSSRDNGVAYGGFNSGYDFCMCKGELVSTIQSDQLNVTMTCLTTSKKLWFDTGSKQWIVAKLNRSGKVRSQTCYDDSRMSEALSDLRTED